MTTITTKLVKDGNSTAVRLTKDVLEMSGLNGDIQLSVEKGLVMLRPLKAKKPRADWTAQIAKVLAEDPQALKRDEELAEWEEETVADGLDDIPWEN